MSQLKLYEEDRINTNEAKYLQRMIINKNYENNICKWILKESGIYEKDNKDHLVYNNHFVNNIIKENNIFFLEKIETIFPFILESFGKIIDYVKRCYCLNDEYVYKITEIFLEKYQEPSKEKIYDNDFIYYKNCDIVINILLSDNNNNILFSDGIISNISMGDTIIFSSKTKHYKLKSNTAPTYFLTGLIKIYKKI
jgi:hypothetical protein